MSIDLNSIPAATRDQQIKLGRQYSSTDTLAQANQTLSALGSYANEVATEGFIAEDGARLSEARDMLLAAGVGRETARGDKKVTNQAYVDALADGKKKRLRGRTVLENTMAALSESSDPSAPDAARAILGTLLQTQTADDDAEKLSGQLAQINATLGLAFVRDEAAKRGGAKAIEDLTSSAATLRAVAQQGATVAGTPAATQLLDHIDGIIIGLCRRARKAARSAAKQHGNPAIATVFELNKLYRSRRRAVGESDEPADDGGATP
jgi:hypothetical protein